MSVTGLSGGGGGGAYGRGGGASTQPVRRTAEATAAPRPARQSVLFRIVIIRASISEAGEGKTHPTGSGLTVAATPSLPLDVAVGTKFRLAPGPRPIVKNCQARARSSKPVYLGVSRQFRGLVSASTRSKSSGVFTSGPGRSAA